METFALWAFEEDIQNRSWKDWLEAHISFLKPLHRYEGLLTVHPDRINFSGIDKKKSNEETFFDLYKYQIEQLYLGFDSTFNIMETKGLPLWRPLRITFTRNSIQENLYIITNYNLVRTDNQEWFDFLKVWLSK